MSVRVREWLEAAGLGMHYASFAAAGLSDAQFVHLRVEEYELFGVSSTRDRQKLFQLLHVLSTTQGDAADGKGVSKGRPELSARIVPAGRPDEATSDGHRVDAPQTTSGNFRDDRARAFLGNASPTVLEVTVTDPEPYVPVVRVARGGALVHHRSTGEEEDQDEGEEGEMKEEGIAMHVPRLVPVRAGRGAHQRPTPVPRRGSVPRLPSDVRTRRGGPPSRRPQPETYSRCSSHPVSQPGPVSIRFPEYGCPPSVPAVTKIPLPATSGPRIRVMIRKRPLNSREKARGESDVVVCDSRTKLTVNEPKQKVDLTRYVDHQAYLFDEVFNETVTNDTIYQRAIYPLLSTTLAGGRATCFAYGQTGSGKTYTMQPMPVMAAKDLFAAVGEGTRFTVSYFEIYGGKLFDLLNGRKRLIMREDGKQVVNICGLQEYTLASPDDLMRAMEHGNRSRSTGVTGANLDSSRSHAILQLSLRNPDPHQPLAKISFIDLAGNERGSDTMDQDRQTRLEGAEINKSLLALKECIRALDHGHGHVPFRGSKLTEVLKDSFTGNSRTTMICNISPNVTSCEHTLNTLRYADRVREIRKSGRLSARSPSPSPRQPLPDAGLPPDSDPTPRRKSLPTPQCAEEEMRRSHEHLASLILAEEDDVVSAHRQQVDEMMAIVQEELQMLANVDSAGWSVDNYVGRLEELLQQKLTTIERFMDKLQGFQAHLQEEEELHSTLGATLRSKVVKRRS